MSARRVEVAVIGAGVVGLAASEALTQAGVDVRCFEQGEPGGGQSAGFTRVFRHVHAQPELIALAQLARRDWDAWSKRAGRELLGDEGVLLASPEARAAAALLAQAGVEHELVGDVEQRKLLPILKPPSQEALFDVRGGAIRVRPTIDALVAWVNERLVRAEVLSVRPDGEGAAIETPEGTWRCDRVLVCAGMGTPLLAARLGVHVPVEVRFHVRGTFALRRRAPRLACWLDRTGIYGATVYSGPVDEAAAFAVGVAADDATGSLERVRTYVKRALPGLEPAPVDVRPCWLTLLPWHADAFAAWRAGPAVVFAGHNLFKFAPTLGRLLAETATSDGIPRELRPPDRPAA